MVADKVTPRDDYSHSPRLPDLLQIVGTGMGVGTMCILNVYKRLPVFHKPLMTLPLYVIAGLGLGTAATRMREDYMDKKTRLAEAYMREHPEMFVEAPPKTYGDVLYQWTPRR